MSLTPRQKLVARFAQYFAKVDFTKVKLGKGRARLRVPPLEPFCTETINFSRADIPVRLLATPEISVPYCDRWHIFASWQDSLTNYLVEPTFDEIVPRELIAYAQKYDNHPAAMLYALGNEIDGRMDVWRKGFLVKLPGTKPFGIKAGAQVHRFGGAVDEGFNVKTWLDMLKGFQSRSGDLDLMLRFAAHNPVAMQALTCRIHSLTDMSVINGRRLFETEKMKAETKPTHGLPTPEQADHIAFETPDPYGEMYITLVPKLLTLKEFEGVFPKWESRRRAGITQQHRVEIFNRIVSLEGKLNGS